jgi:hypothetical protein
MSREKSNRLHEIVEAISLLKNAESAWPAGWSHPLLKEVLQRTEKELQEDLFEIMSQKKRERSSGKKKPASLGETSRT